MLAQFEVLPTVQTVAMVEPATFAVTVMELLLKFIFATVGFVLLERYKAELLLFTVILEELPTFNTIPVWLKDIVLVVEVDETYGHATSAEDAPFIDPNLT
jgi:hypothetical protein